MFTGIIETLGVIKEIEKEGTNYHYTVLSDLSHELKIDQSVSHNGVCLTVTELVKGGHKVTAIEETMLKTTLGSLKENSIVNIERAMVSGGRLDGHIVQGHVDGTGKCVDIKEVEGSWYFTFSYQPTPLHFLVDKGSICINGVSLTVVNPVDDQFSVAIIPYTYEHTSFRDINIGDSINLEFDVLGKYIAKYMQLYVPALRNNFNQ